MENSVKTRGSLGGGYQESGQAIFLNRRIGKGWRRHADRRDARLKTKFDTLLRRQGKSPSEVYKKRGIDKADWSRIVWGVIIPDIATQVAIAKELECDSAVLWGELTEEEEAILTAKPEEEGK